MRYDELCNQFPLALFGTFFEIAFNTSVDQAAIIRDQAAIIRDQATIIRDQAAIIRDQSVTIRRNVTEMRSNGVKIKNISDIAKKTIKNFKKKRGR